MPDKNLGPRSQLIRTLLGAQKEGGGRPPLPQDVNSLAQSRDFSDREALINLLVRMAHSGVLDEIMAQQAGRGPKVPPLQSALGGLANDDELLNRVLAPLREQAEFQGAVRRR